MFKIAISIFLFLNFFLQGIGAAERTQKDRMLTDLDFIQQVFECCYAPAEWKQEQFDWNLNRKIETAKRKVGKIEENDIKRFQIILKQFLNSVRDYHVNVSFSSTESASLPFNVQWRSGKYIIVKINEGENSPLGIGDEVLTLGGIAVESLIADLKKETLKKNRLESDHSLALETLTYRCGALGHQVPQGSAVVEIKKYQSEKIETHEVFWDYKSEQVFKPPMDKNVKHTKKRPGKSLLRYKCDQRAVIPYHDVMVETFADYASQSNFSIPRKNIQSNQGRAAQENEEESLAEQNGISPDSIDYFQAELVKLPSGKRTGYVKISTFEGRDFEEAVEAFLSCMDYFQKEADALIINLNNNPGGKVWYMYALASILTDRPLENLKHRFMLTREDVCNALETIEDFKEITTHEEAIEEIGETALGFPVSLRVVHNWLKEAEFKLEQWQQGRRLTDPFYMEGMDLIEPHPKVNFTKPIVILINERDFSCADFFPAIFQDNKRAILVGNTTGGAGGMVESISFPNLNGIRKISYTKSICMRSNVKLIENLGVEPDIPFDFKNEWGDSLIDAEVIFNKILDITDRLL